MTRRSALVLAALLPVSGALQAQQAPAQAPSPEPETPRFTLEAAKAPGVEVHWVRIPWGPQTFQAMEAPGDSFYNKRTWPFARLENTVPLQLEGTQVPPGNYALVFHPNNMKDEGMSLEVRRIQVPEFLQAGNAMTQTPEGESIFQQPIRFDTASGVAPTLEIKLTPSKGELKLTVRYGDRQLVKIFKE